MAAAKRARVMPGKAKQQGQAATASRSRLFSWLAGGVSLALIGTIAVITAGYDARETPREEPSVWAVRSAGQYARVNTLTAEIDTVRKVEEPTGVLQSGANSVVLSHGNGRAWTIDPAQPGNLVETTAERAEDQAGKTPDADLAANDESAAGGPATGPGESGSSGPTSVRTPDGTRDIVSSQDGAVFRTEDGRVFYSAFEKQRGSIPPELGKPVQLDPLAGAGDADESEAGDKGADAKQYHADAVAIDADGRITMYSSSEQAVRSYDIDRGEFNRGVREVPGDLPEENLRFTTVAGKWVLLDAETGNLWREGSAAPIEIAIDGVPHLQAASPKQAGDEVLVADEGGLWSIARDEAERVERFEGTPAQPIALGETRYASWVGNSAGQLWSSRGGGSPLELDDSVKLPGDPELVIRSNGSSALVTEVKTGMMWTVPDGTLIPVEQWSLADPPREQDGIVVVDDVTEQEPPVAVADVFGVRAGEPAPLPVLLNDFDPNRKDVLTIVPEGLGEGLPESFGTVSVLPDGQSLVIAPTPAASGTASFSYRITDGVLMSEPATVTLNVVDPEENTGPEWCPVQGCQREWPSPEITPGGTLVMPILDGWVDPEGDPMMLESATPVNADDPIRALVASDGRLAIRHTDPNAPDSDVAVKVRAADSRGEATERELHVQVRRNAKAELMPIAVTAEVGKPTTVRPLGRVVGGSGSVVLVDASVQSGAATAAVNAGTGTVSVTAQEAGSSVLALTLRDTGTDAEITGAVRVTAVDARPRLSLPPLRAFVRPLADTTVDVLDAVPSANSRALVVRSANVLDGELRADVIEHARVRVSGSTADGAPGRIGSADIGIAEGGEVATGRLTVFQVPDSGAAGAIAVADAVTVRAGAIADIPVLENDVAPPGQRLVLHPEISGSGTKGELAFASGNTLRYLAPATPGTYTLSYTTYSASSPEASDVGQVRVTVLPREGNRDPQPPTLTVRLAPGERVTTPVPLSGVDPDGDRVRLVRVGASDDPRLTATLAPRSSALQVEASRKAEPGLRLLSYTVRDEFGGRADGTLRVIITEADPSGGAPVTYSDYVRLAQGVGEPAVVRPLDNDVDPANGKLELLEVVPNVPGGKDSPEYRDLAARLDTSDMKQGRVTVRGGDELGTVSYRYTARSSASTSTAEGLIVVQVSARVGQQAPTVRDTVLSARDRTELERGGVDVVTDRVTWAGGDVRSLKMTVWGGASEHFTAKGNRIVGKYRAEGDLVPFKLSGVDMTGAEVESFGFLVVPPLDELRLTLKPGLAPIRVEEGKSVDVALADVIDLATGDRAEFKAGAFGVQRAQASCEAKSATTLSYVAGKEAPWADACLLSVKLTEQNAWTQLALPIEIVPNEPVAELETLTRTVSPGASETIDLADMVRWQGGRDGKIDRLTFAISGGGGAFEVAPGGRMLTVQARADAVPGTQDALIVSVSGAGESQAPLTLRVGEAARDTPRGATVQLSCTVGSDCQAQLIGAPGEYDPFAGKSGGGLQLDGVTGGACAVASFQATGEGVAVTWPNGARGAGGKCTASFTVRDAQNRVGQGVIELDAQGVPRPPASVTPVSASGSSVTLSVALSGESSYPATTGVQLISDGGGSVGSCALAGGQASCTVSGLTPGEKHSYTARAVNSVGESDPSANGAVTWAYVPPPPPSLSAETMKWQENTDPNAGKVRVKIGQSKSPTVVLSVDGTEIPISGDGTYVLSTETHTFSVISADSPESIPPGYTGGDGGRGDASTASVKPIGAPTAAGATAVLSLSGNSETRWALEASGFGENGGDALSYRYGIEESQAAPACTGWQQSGIAKKFVYLTGSVCASNSYGTTGPVASNTVFTGGSVPPPNAVKYAIGSSPSTTVTNSSVSYSGVAPDEAWMVTVSGAYIVWEIPVSATTASSPNASARQCVDAAHCSEPVDITPQSGKTPFSVTWNGTCIPADTPLTDWGTYFTITGSPGENPIFTKSGATDALMSWISYGSVTFTGAVCEAPPPSPDPPPTTP